MSYTKLVGGDEDLSPSTANGIKVGQGHAPKRSQTMGTSRPEACIGFTLLQGVHTACRLSCSQSTKLYS